MTNQPKKLFGSPLLVAIFATLALAGCGSDSPAVESAAENTMPAAQQSSSHGVEKPDHTSASDSTTLKAITARNELVSRVSLFTDIQGALPINEYVVDGSTVRPSDLLAAGEITRVEAGRSFTWTTNVSKDGEIRSELPYNDAEAMVSTIHVTMAVDSQVASPDLDTSLNLESITFGLALSGQVDVAAAEADLVGLGRVVGLFVDESPVFDYDSDLFAVLWDGAFLGTVAADGRVAFPAVDSGLVPDDLAIDELLDPRPALDA